MTKTDRQTANETLKTEHEPALHLIFGTGPVGVTLAEELLARGEQVRLVNRSGKGVVPAGAELVACDVSQLEPLKELSRGASVLYNCTHAPYERWPEVLPRLQENLIETAAVSGAKLVVIDTLYLYGPTQGEPMHEATPHLATSRKGRLRAELAWGYLQAHRSGHARVAIGRAADFYGPQVLNAILGDYVLPAALTGEAVLTLGDTSLPHSFSYIKDVARGLATLGTNDDALGREWLLPVNTAPTDEVLRELELLIGKPITTFNVPTTEQLQRDQILGTPFSDEYVELFYQYTEPQIVGAGAIAQAFEVQATPLRESLAETVRWYTSLTSERARL